MARKVFPRLLAAAVATAALAMEVAATHPPPHPPHPPHRPSIGDLARTLPEISTVVAIADFADARGAGLFDSVSNVSAPPVTIFSPNNGAMLGLARTLGYTGSDEKAGLAFTVAALTHLGGGDPAPLIRTILTYAVLPDVNLNATALASAGPLVSLQGGRVRVLSDGSVVDKAPAVADGQIVRANLGGANGFLHVVDRVLLPLPLCPAVVRRACVAAGGLLDEKACVCVRRVRRRRRRPRNVYYG